MQYKRSNKESIIKAIDFLKSANLDDESIENEFAIERAFEVIGGILKVWVSEDRIEKSQLVENAIKTRDKISHLYSGFNFFVAQKAIIDLDSIINIVKKIQD